MNDPSTRETPPPVSQDAEPEKTRETASQPVETCPSCGALGYGNATCRTCHAKWVEAWGHQCDCWDAEPAGVPGSIKNASQRPDAGQETALTDFCRSYYAQRDRADAAEAKLTNLLGAMGTADYEQGYAWTREIGGTVGRIENERDEARAKLDQVRAILTEDGYGDAADRIGEILVMLYPEAGEPVTDREEPVAWEDLRPYEQQQGGYWVYPPGTDVYGNGKRWVPVKRPEESAGETKPRVFFPGDTVPAQVIVSDEYGHRYGGRTDSWVADDVYVDLKDSIIEQWQSLVDSARRERAGQSVERQADSEAQR